MAKQWVVTHGAVFLSRLDIRKPRRGKHAGRVLTTIEWAEGPAQALHFDRVAAKTFANVATNIGGSKHGIAPYAAKAEQAVTP